MDNHNFAELNEFETEPNTPVEVATAATGEQEETAPEPEEVVTTRSLSEKGLPKMLILGGGVMVVLLMVGAVLSSTMRTLTTKDSEQEKPQVVENFSDPMVPGQSESTEDLKTKVALTSQERELADLNRQATRQITVTQSPASLTPKTKPVAKAASVQATAPVQAEVPPSASVAYNAPSPVEPYTPVLEEPEEFGEPLNLPDPEPVEPSYTPVASAPQPAVQQKQAPHEQEVNSMEDWVALSKMGSYGDASPRNTEAEVASANPSTTVSEVPETASEVALETATVASSESEYTPAATGTASVSPENTPATASDTNRVAADAPPTSASEVASEVPAQDSQLTPVSNSPAATPSTAASKLDAESEAILNEHPMAVVNVAAKAKGVLETTFIQAKGDAQTLQTTSTPSQFLVRLTSPLDSTDGSVALPVGSQIVAQVNSVYPNGFVKASGTTVITDEGGQLRQIPLPSGAVEIVEKDGNPLQAKSSANKGGARLGMDARTFALGAASKAASLLNRPNQSVVSNNGGYLISDQNPSPDVAAGLIEGGTTALLSQVRARNQKALQELDSQPEVMVLNPGKKVELIAVRPFTLPRSVQ